MCQILGAANITYVYMRAHARTHRRASSVCPETDVLMAAHATWGVPIALPLGFEPGWSADGTAARGPSSAVARADDGRHGVGSHAGSASWARWGAGRVACVVGTMWAEAWRPRRVLLPARCLLGPAASTATVAPTALPRRVLRAVARSM